MFQPTHLDNVFKARRVLVTGHTGFKGSWLTVWLSQLGAEVIGFSDGVPSDPSMFNRLDVANHCEHVIGDINNFGELDKAVKDARPHLIFHLAAQPIVRESYVNPLTTLSTNVIGTANLLESVRRSDLSCALVIVTSDKCYENNGTFWGFREDDPMGGHDVYSMSKGAAELVVASWRRSFFSGDSSHVRLATARAGNVIGGGDWAADRIVPDCIQALRAGLPISVRNPFSTRPWQHVLEPLSGYMCLAASMIESPYPDTYSEGWNFGPTASDERTVKELVDELISNWGEGSWLDVSSAGAVTEARTLSLSCEKANKRLHWSPVWSFEHAIMQTVDWYQASFRNDRELLHDFTLNQINSYISEAKTKGLLWARDPT